MKKMISILMALVLVLALAACGGTGSTQNGAVGSTGAVATPEPTPATIYGTWEGTLDMTDKLIEEVDDEAFAKYLKSFPMIVTVTFNEDNTCHLVADGTGAADNLKDAMSQYLVDMVKEQTGMEMSLEEIEQLAGFSVSDYVDEMIQDLLTTADETYTLDGNHFVLSNSGDGEFNGDVMVLHADDLGDITLNRK